MKWRGGVYNFDYVHNLLKLFVFKRIFKTTCQINVFRLLFLVVVFMPA